MINIFEQISNITQNSLPFMEGREKMESDNKVLFNAPLTLDEHDYLEGDDGEFAVITVKEYPNNFFFGSSVVTDALKKLDIILSNASDEQLEEIEQTGVTFKLEKVMSKNKRKYTKITFFPK